MCWWTRARAWPPSRPTARKSGFPPKSAARSASSTRQARKIIDRVKFEVPGLRAENVQPVGINISHDGKLAFVSLGPANRIAVVDVKTRQVIKYLLVGQRVWHAAFTPDDKFLLTANGVSNDVSVIDVAALKVVKSIQVGESPWELVIPRPAKTHEP